MRTPRAPRAPRSRVELPAGQTEHFRDTVFINAQRLRRHRRGVGWSTVFQLSTLVGIVALAALLLNVLNACFGLVAYRYALPPERLLPAGREMSDLSNTELIELLRNGVSGGLMRRWEQEHPLAERSRTDLEELVVAEVLRQTIARSWNFLESVLQRPRIEAEVARDFPDARLAFRSWITPRFLVASQSSDPSMTGIRTALLGTLWMMVITVVVAFPLGVGAAIYLEEYASNNWLNRLIRLNIYNLAGVPSIIYGMLGLAVFVRILEPVTSGAIFGAVADRTTANGRTIVSAGLTLALLVLPLIIINSQEAIRAVPRSLRESSYAVGATRWQTIWHHVLPASLDRILTGTILAVSRAIGETAPLVVVGASTLVTQDPAGLFSKFTVLPIQIYQWTSRPQALFRNVAAAAIIALLVLLLAMNASAVLLRDRYSRLRRES